MAQKDLPQPEAVLKTLLSARIAERDQLTKDVAIWKRIATKYYGELIEERATITMLKKQLSIRRKIKKRLEFIRVKIFSIQPKIFK
jgi:hypothetical protein